MIFLKEAVEQALLSTGQVFYQIEEIGFHWEQIGVYLFEPAVTEYSGKRPNQKIVKGYYLHEDGFTIPESWSTVFSVTPSHYTGGDQLYPLQAFPQISDIKSPIQRDGKIYAPSGYYDITYAEEIKVYRDTISYTLPATERRLRGLLDLENTKIRIGSQTFLGSVENRFYTEGSSEVAFTFDPTTGALSAPLIPVDMSFQKEITIDPYLGRVVKEITDNDTAFLRLWRARFLAALATARQLFVLPDTQFDLTRDELMSYAREAESSLSEYWEYKTKWWIF